MSTEIASLLVTAEAQTGDAERALDRLGIKFDSTVERMRGGQGRFVSFGAANKSAAAEVKRHSDAVEHLRGRLQGATQTITQVGVALTAGITLPLMGATAAIIHIGTKTATSLNTLQAVTRATDADMQRARATARALGADLTLPGTSASDSALAMVELSKGGLTLEQSMKAARGTIQLARAATIGEAQAAIIAADALNTFSLAGDQAGRVADILAGSANASSGEITDMAAALAQVGAVAKGAGLNIEDTATAISLLAKNGVKGSDAGTSLKTFLLALQSPISNDAVEMMDRLGVSAYDLQTKAFKPLPQLIGEFKAKLDGLNPQAQAKALREIFGQDAIRAARILFGESTAGFLAMRTAITRSGSAADIAGAKAKGLGGAWEGLISTLETFAGDIFADIEVPLTKMVQGVSKGVQFLADAWNNMSTPAKTALMALLSFAAAAGPALVVLGTLAGVVLSVAGSLAAIGTAVAAAGGLSAIAGIVAPAIAVIAALGVVALEVAAIAAAAAAVIYKAWTSNFLGIQQITARAWNAIKSFVLDVWQELVGAYMQIMPQLQTITRNVLGLIQAFWTAHGEKIIATVRLAWDIITTGVKAGIKILSSTIAGILAIINGDWQTAWDMAVRAVDAAGKAWETINARILISFVKLLKFIEGLALRFLAAGIMLGWNLITGIADEITRGFPRIVSAVVAGAALLSSPHVLLAYAAAGASQARARNEGFEANVRVQTSNMNPKRDTGDEAEWVQPGSNSGRRADDGAENSYNKKKETTLPGLPGGGGGGGEGAVKKLQRLAVQDLETAVAAIERLNQRALADADYFYAEGLQKVDDYLAAKRAAADSLFAVEQARDRGEKAALASSGLRGKEREVAERALNEKIAATQTKYDDTRTQIERDGFTKRRALARTEWDGRLAATQEFGAGMEAVYQRMADQGVQSYLAAQQAIDGAQMELLIAQKVGIERQQIGLNETSEMYVGLAGQLDVATQAIANFRERMIANSQDANRRDIDSLKQHRREVATVWDSIASLELDIQRDRLRIFEQMGASKELIWRREMQLDLQAAEASRKRRVDDLTQQREHIEQTIMLAARKSELLQAIDARITAEERRGAQDRENIVAEYYDKQRQRLRDWADKAVGNLKTALDRYKQEGLKGFFSSIGESFRDTLEQMALDLLKARVLSLLQTVFKVPQVGAEDAASSRTTSSGLSGILQRVFGMQGAKQDAASAQATATAAPIVSAVDRANQSITGGIGQQIRESGLFGAQSADVNTQSIISAIFAAASQVSESLQQLTPDPALSNFNHAVADSSKSTLAKLPMGGAVPALTSLLSGALSNNGDGAAVTRAGKAATGAIKAGWEKSKDKIETTGNAQAKTLSTVGQSIVSTMLQVASVISSGQSGMGFWKGLLFAAGSGALSALGGSLASGGTGGGTSGGGSGGGSSSPGGDGFARGGFVAAASGGRNIRVAEGGYDEVVLTTDPAHRNRMEQLMHAYSRMTGISAGDFAQGGFVSGFKPSSSGRYGGGTNNSRVVHVNLTQEIHTNSPEALQRSSRQNARRAREAIASVF